MNWKELSDGERTRIMLIAIFILTVIIFAVVL